MSSNDQNDADVPRFVSPHRTRRIWNTLLRLAISSLAIFLILQTVDVSGVLPFLKDADLLYVAAAILVILLTRVLMAWKWQLLLHYAGFKQPFLYLLKTILLSNFMGFFLPSGVGVDVIRTVAVGRRTGFTASAISTVADRIMAIVTMILCSSTAALIALPATPELGRTLWIVIALSLLIMSILALLLSKPAIRVVSWVDRHINSESVSPSRPDKETISHSKRFIRIATEKATLAHAEVRGLLSQPRVFASSLLLNALVQLARIMLFAFLFLACGVQVSIMYHIIFVPIIMILTLLPVSFFGVGVREGACVFFYSQISVDPALALTVSVWTYLVTVPVLAIGGLLFLIGPSKSPSASVVV